MEPSTSSAYEFDPDEHLDFLQDIDHFIDELNEIELPNGLAQCVECNDPYPIKDLMWECPDTGNMRCPYCQNNHEKNECSSCRLAYEDV